MSKVAVFVDYANINCAARNAGLELNYADLLDYLVDGRQLQEAFCYFPLDPRAPYARDAEIENLWIQGYLVRSKTGSIAADSYKCNCDVEMALDMMHVAYTARPDVIVLVSGDIDMIPVVIALRHLGIRVEVAAFLDSAAREMLLKSSSFTDLDSYFEHLTDCTAAELQSSEI